MVNAIADLQQRAPVLSWVAFAALQTLVALCGVLPASIGGIASGMVFGVTEGFILSGIGTLAGALGAFFLSRKVFREQIHDFLARRRFLAMLDDMATEQGWKIVCLLRISPVLPFAITSYALGLTTIGSVDYLIGTLAALPSLLGYVVIGHLARNSASDMSAGNVSLLHLGMTVLAIIATVLLLWQFGKVAGRYFRSASERPFRS